MTTEERSNRGIVVTYYDYFDVVEFERVSRRDNFIGTL